MGSLGSHGTLPREGLHLRKGKFISGGISWEKHPEKRDELKQRIRKKKFEIVRQGELVIDTNYTLRRGW